MLSTALVIFREALEIALIIGVVLAATKGASDRYKWVLSGLGIGILGSAFVAMFTDKISQAAEGLGQELFNAGILMVAAFFIGWTVVWMSKHAKDMMANMKKVGNKVVSGELPFYALTSVIAIAMLREGSEIVLFTYAMLTSGQSVSSIVMGSLIGGSGGILLGVLIYLGLVQISTKYLFRVTSWMLMLLVAGLMSQAAGYLVAAGHFENLAQTMWDTSWLLSDDGIIGQTFQILIGYTAKPMAIQLIFYITTLGVILTMLKIINSGTSRAIATSLILLGSAFFALNPSDANATKKVYSPYVEKGELEFEWRGGYQPDEEVAKHKLAVGYGITERWFSEVYAEIEKEKGESYDMTAIEWENKFQLTEQSEYWADLGALVETAFPLEDNGAYKIEAFLLGEKETGQFSHRANFKLEHELGKHSEDGLEGGFAWSTRYRYQTYFEPAFEYHIDFGRFKDDNDFDEQKHQFGPAIYGDLPHGFGYDIGYLFGLSDAAPDQEIKWILEYELHF